LPIGFRKDVYLEGTFLNIQILQTFFQRLTLTIIREASVGIAGESFHSADRATLSYV
jgi:hypothetical protein